MRLDRLLSRRLASRLAGVIVIFFGLICLSQSLDTYVVQEVGRKFGGWAALGWIAVSAARWSIKALPVTVLIGGILMLMSLQASRELLVIKASGRSIWQILRGPVLVIAAFGLFTGLWLDTWVTSANRALWPSPPDAGITQRTDRPIWLKQSSGDYSYILRAERADSDKAELYGVTVFFAAKGPLRRIGAESAQLRDGEWQFVGVSLFDAEGQTTQKQRYVLPTRSARSDLVLKFTSVEDFTRSELNAILARGLGDPVLKAAVRTRIERLYALPVLLVGSLLIAFAFSAGYRRTNSYARAIISGIVLGFLIFVINEMAVRAGAAGVIDPTMAAWGPALLAVALGVTVLLHKEDGRV